LNKAYLFDLIDENQQELKEMAFEIWSNPELAFNEYKASKLQKDYLREQGFKIIDVPNVPTAFIAEFGEGKPVLGILGEYDALPGLSQKISAEREEMEGTSNGHGCGHNLLGTGGVGAITALKKVMEKENFKGTIRYYGCPAEETLAGKVFMAKEGVFDDLDSCISWHPASMNVVWGCRFLAVNSMKFRFKGIPAHAALVPHAGRSALDAVELMNVGANYLREHVIDKARIHYVITNGGMAPNVVPEDAEVWYYVRAPRRKDVIEISDRLYKIAEGAALMTETTMKYELVAGCYDVVPNRVLSDIMHKNMLETGVEIEARPAGKKITRLSLLSGGERSLAALALLVAIFKARPSPFYVLDEVEAALDDQNLSRLITIFKELQQDSQLIIVTHQKRTMKIADALYGVTMRGGVTQVVSSKLADTEQARAEASA